MMEAAPAAALANPPPQHDQLDEFGAGHGRRQHREPAFADRGDARPHDAPCRASRRDHGPGNRRARAAVRRSPRSPELFQALAPARALALGHGAPGGGQAMQQSRHAQRQDRAPCAAPLWRSASPAVHRWRQWRAAIKGRLGTATLGGQSALKTRSRPVAGIGYPDALGLESPDLRDVICHRMERDRVVHPDPPGASTDQWPTPRASRAGRRPAHWRTHGPPGSPPLGNCPVCRSRCSTAELRQRNGGLQDPRYRRRSTRPRDRDGQGPRAPSATPCAAPPRHPVGWR